MIYESIISKKWYLVHIYKDISHKEEKVSYKKISYEFLIFLILFYDFICDASISLINTFV